MTDFVWPPLARQSSIVWRPLSNTEISPAPLTGGLQAASRPGDRLGCTISVANSTGSERRRLRSLASLLRGALNPIYVPDLAFKRAGSWGSVVGGELFTNADFSNGTTGWTGDNCSLDSNDGTLRLTASAVAASLGARQSTTLTANAPHIARSLIQAGRGFSGLALGPFVQDGGSISANGTSATRGYLLATMVPLSGSAGSNYAGICGASNGFVAGEFFEIPFVSLSRCMLTDSAGNLLLQSDAFDNAAYSKTNVTVSANAVASPDGTSTADGVVENAANAVHEVGQVITVSSAAGDYAFAVALKDAGNGHSWAKVYLHENISGHDASFFVNLSSGALGTVATTGANWTNVRAFTPVSLGNGWWLVGLCARKAGAATGVTATIGSATANGTASFAGNSLTAFYAWRATLTQSSVSTRLIASTTAVAASTQSGATIFVKGAPASQKGLLREGDQFEIDKQLKIVTASFDTDASGGGYLEFEPPLARSVADNTPIIVHNPLCKMRMVSDAEYENRPGGVSDFRFDFVQDLSP